MQRTEKLIVVRDLPAAVAEAIDGIMATQGMTQIAAREIEEDFTPLINDPAGPVVIILSEPHDDWTACYTSLSPDDEWALSEALALALEQPTVFALIDDVRNVYAYRYFDDGVLHEEALPDDMEARLDGTALLERWARHGIPTTLIDDRAAGFGAPHLLLGYSSTRHRPTAPAAAANDSTEPPF
jgi:hypothetical protein